MPRVTEQLLRKRSEHNDSLLSTLEEVDLHQEGLTRLGPRLRRACPRLQHLSLSGNALGRLAPPELRGLRSLRTLNLALNCLRRLPTADVLRGLESLERLDLTANFLDASALFALGVDGGEAAGGGAGGGGSSAGALAQLPRLAELWLMGNPCVEAMRKAAVVEDQAKAEQPPEGANPAPRAPSSSSSNDAYRSYVLLALPQLQRLDGDAATAAARLAARRDAGLLTRALRRAAAAELGGLAVEEEEEQVAALELAIVSGAEHPETLALYGPPGALGDETSESEGEDEDEDDEDDDDTSRRHPPRRPRVQETGTLDVATGEVRRPWCPATRLLDLRDQRRAKAGEGKKDHRSSAATPAASAAAANTGNPTNKSNDLFAPGPLERRPQPRRQALPPLPDHDPGTGETLPLRNEGRWRFSLDLAPAAAGGGDGGRAGGGAGTSSSSSSPELELDVDVGKYLDTSHMQLEVLPRAVRLLVRGRLLQLRLPAEVRADACAARRSRATGRLSVRMPLLFMVAGSAAGQELLDDLTLVHPRSVWGMGEEREKEGREGRVAEATAAAAVVFAAAGRGPKDDDDDNDDSPPPL